MEKKVGIFCILGFWLFFSALNAFAAEKIEIKSLPEGGYLLYLDEKPFLIKGVGYSPTPIGKGYDYDFFSDPNKPWHTDGKLMQAAGINCVRIYSAGKDLEKVREFIRDMYEQFGIYTLMSDWLGLWDYPRANYADASFKNGMKERILKIATGLKDEDGLLMWILGNENNYTFSGKIGFWTSEEIEKIKEPRRKQTRKAEIYYRFVDELAQEIKKVDHRHPVALGNGEASFLGVASGICNNIDALAIIIYRGKKFGNLFNNIRTSFDKPILLSEFGCDSYNAYKKHEDQEIQSQFLLTQWENLYANTAYSGNKNGNALGGAIFEWSDEWWKHDESYEDGWALHNTEAHWSHGAYFYDIKAKDNLNMNEEWFGIVSLSEERVDGLNKRLPKKSYYALSDYLAGLKFGSPADSSK
jgi:hypothetical protein